MHDIDAVYCLNGHYMGTLPEDISSGLYPGRLHELMRDEHAREIEKQSCCPRCGKSAISSCRACGTGISREGSRPAHCEGCGKAFPWTETNLSSEDIEASDFGPLGI
jgi:hypothetical protein